MTGGNTFSSDGLIAKIIWEHPGRERYDDLIGERNINFFRRLSSLRENLLMWFPFERRFTALEIGGGFGELTGVLSRQFGRVDVLEPDPLRAEAIRCRYQGRDNVRVIETEPDAFAAAEKYDAVIMADLTKDQIGPIAKLLEKLSALVRVDGVILLGFCNKYAVKYFCGGTDHHVQMPFDTSGLLSKKEIDSAAGEIFPYLKWYYLMPDECVTQAVYTDRSDFSTLSDRVLTLNAYNSPEVCDEKQTFIEYAQNGTITEHANYYLAEIRKQPKENRITEVYLSADREQGHRYQVTVTEDTVIKIPLDSESAASLEQEYQNNRALKSRGIKVVDETLTDGMIRMPRINAPGLMSHIGKISTREELFAVFDQLYSNILRSSDETEEGVLKTGYIDMIPLNIFRKDGEMLYYDQEYTAENCDAAYIMFRAIFFTWLHEPQLGKIISADEMRQRYSISDQKWEEYSKTEEEFISRNRRHEDLAQVHRWTAVFTPEQLHQNRCRLLGYDPKALREIQLAELDILRYFLDFCKQNSLTCFALHGTMLGAVRYGGMIPWDDDIDIGMKREDYDRLISLFDNSSNAPYFLQTMQNNPGVFYGGYAKLHREDTTRIESFNRYHNGSLSIAIDIFPLDYCEEEYDKHIKRQRAVSHLQRLIFAKRYPHKAGLIPDVPEKYISLYYIITRFIPKSFLFDQLEKHFRSVPKSSQRAILACYYKDSANRSIFDDCDLNDLTEMPFEGMMIPVLRDADKYLIRRFGPDYMAEPYEKQPKHKGVFYDTTKSYKEYRM